MNQYSNSLLIKKKADELEMQELKRINDEVIIIKYINKLGIILIFIQLNKKLKKKENLLERNHGIEKENLINKI